MKRSVALLVSVLLGMFAAIPAVHAGQGSGNPKLSVTPGTISPTGVTEITVRGYDYLVPPHAPGTSVFGGVYVVFGWVVNPNAFGPSLRNSANNNGTFGVSYLYPGMGGDANLRDDGSGQIRLVSFTAGGESGGATDYHMDPDGNWTTTIKVSGSSFSGYDPRTGKTFDVDCLQVQCGVFTLGAHGKVSATNEKFTPVNFTSPPTTTSPKTTATSTPTTSAPTATTVPPPATTSPGNPTTSNGGSAVPPTANPGDSSTTTTSSVAPGNSGEPTQPTDPAAGGTDPTTTLPVTEVSDGQAIAAEVVATRDLSNPVPLVLGAVLLLGAGAGLWLWRRRKSEP